MQGSVCFIWAVIIQDHVYKLAVVTNAELEYNITIFGKGFLNIPKRSNASEYRNEECNSHN